MSICGGFLMLYLNAALYHCRKRTGPSLQYFRRIPSMQKLLPRWSFFKTRTTWVSTSSQSNTFTTDRSVEARVKAQNSATEDNTRQGERAMNIDATAIIFILVEHGLCIFSNPPPNSPNFSYPTSFGACSLLCTHVHPCVLLQYKRSY